LGSGSIAIICLTLGATFNVKAPMLAPTSSTISDLLNFNGQYSSAKKTPLKAQ
jgi:hypothetical protein